MDVKKLRKLAEMNEPLPPESITTIRVDFDDPDISPLIIRGLFAKYGKVGEVSVYSGRTSRETYCYALVDLPDRDAIEVLTRSDTERWRGTRMDPVIATKGFTRPWSPHHGWKPSKTRDDENDGE
jgi:hypothetical protein